MGNRIIKRSEAAEQDTWSTKDLYEDDQAWQADLEKLKKMGGRLDSYQGRITASGTILYEYLQFMDEMNGILDDVYRYSALKHDEDTKNSKYQAMNSTARRELVKLGSACSFEKPELAALSDETLGEFLTAVPELALYQRYIERMRAQKEHVLSAAEERLLAMTADIAKSPEHARRMISDADLLFPAITDEKGESAPVTNSSFISYLESPVRRVRQEAYESLYSVYRQFENTYATLLEGQMKQLAFYAGARKYPNTLSAALAATEVPEQVYHSLIKAVNENTHHLHRYISLRKKLLGVEELHFYDLYTPMVKIGNKDNGANEVSGASVLPKVYFEQARQQVLEALAPLGEEYLQVIQKGFAERWIDVYENEGKRSGAYSSGARCHPYVLLNYRDTIMDEFTLAHEMGHALHSCLSHQNQPAVYSNYVIFVAEVASTCNEALLMRYLLAECREAKERAYLVNHFLERFRQTVYRQTMFAEFELWANEICERGEALTASVINEQYADLNRKYYGEDIVADDFIAVEWARIPHFYLNYYVYQYATGFCAAIALAEKILSEGAPAVANYLKFLGSGSSQDPISLLKLAGVDMSTAEPVREALRYFGELLDEFERNGDYM